MALLDRYLCFEFLAYFAVVLAGFVVLMTGNTAYTMLDLVAAKQIPFWVLSQILLLRIPAMAVLGMPVATQFAVFLTLGRLARDSEFIALRSGGASFRRIALPFVGFAFAVSLGSFWLNEMVVPDANHVSQNLLRQFFIADRVDRPQADTFVRLPGGLVLFTSAYDEHRHGLGQLVLFDLPAQTIPLTFPKITLAEHGSMTAHSLILDRGATFEFDGSGALERNAVFDRYVADISRELAQVFETKTVQETMAPQARQEIDSEQQAGIPVAAKETDYYFKFSIPLANLALTIAALVFITGAPRRENYAGVLAGLGMILVYWVGMTITRSMGQNGQLAPIVAAWSPDLVTLAIGLPLLAFVPR